MTKFKGELSIMAPTDGTVLDYVVLNKGFSINEVEDIISLSSHNDFFFSPVDGEVVNVSNEMGIVEIKVYEGVFVIVSTHINKNIISIEYMIEVSETVLTGQPLMYVEAEEGYNIPVTIAVKRSDSILRLVKSKNKNFLVDEFVMKLNLG